MTEGRALVSSTRILSPTWLSLSLNYQNVVISDTKKHLSKLLAEDRRACTEVAVIIIELVPQSISSWAVIDTRPRLESLQVRQTRSRHHPFQSPRPDALYQRVHG